MISLQSGASRAVSMAGSDRNGLAPLVARNGATSPAPNINVSSTTKAITITWVNNSANNKGFRIERSADGTIFKQIAIVSASKTSFTDKTALSGATYVYRVTVFNKTSATPSDASKSITLLPPPPPVAPTSLVDAKSTTSSITLSWKENATTQAGFHLYRSTDGQAYTLIASLKGNAHAFTDSQLPEGTTYFYELSAWNGAGETYASVPFTAATLGTPVVTPAPITPPPTLSGPTGPEAPTAPTFSNVTGSSVTLSWSDPSTNISGYRIYRSTDGQSYTLVGNVDANTSSFTDSGLTAQTGYAYEIGAWNSTANELSDASTVSTLVALPSAPTSLATSNVTTSSLTLSWAPTATNQTGYRIYRSVDGTNFAAIGSTGSNDTHYNDSSLNAGTTYWYKVAARNAGGQATSGAISVTTTASQTITQTPPAPITAPAAPTNLAFSNVTTSAITLSWSAPGGQTGYHVYRSTDGTNFMLVTTADAGVTTWTDSGLSSGTSYAYEVGAFNTGGETRSAAASIGTQTPAPPPAPAPVGGVTFSIRNETSFNELVITGTSGNDSIAVTQSGGVLNIVANGQTTTYDNTFGDLKIYGANGNDTIVVNSSVNIATLIYGGDGNDTIYNLTTGKATIVTIGNGVNNVTGNGVNTAYWVNNADTVHASSAETALKGVNRVGGFFQGVSRNLYGQNLADPTDSGTEIRLTNSSFWGTGPTMNDINQTGLSDCYFLAPLASMAYSEPQKLMNMAVDLGDGTYAFRFVRGGTNTYVRVDGDLAAGYWSDGLGNATPGANGNEWGSLFEKAYADFRTGADSYASLNWGSQSSTFSDLGMSTNALTPNATPDSSVLSVINSNLSAGHAVVASTNGVVRAGAPLIQSHVYSVIGAFRSGSGAVMVQLRNPWGVDGAGNDGNPNDGIVTIDFATFAANFNALNYVNA